MNPELPARYKPPLPYAEYVILLAKTKEVINNPDTMSNIYEIVANGGSLIDFCKEQGARYSDVAQWLYRDEERKDFYEAALKARGEWFVQRILKELLALSTVDIMDAFDDKGCLKDLKDIPENARAAIAGIETFEEYTKGDNPEYLGRTRKIKLYDKNRAVELLGKNYDMFVEKVHIKVDINLANEINKARARLNRINQTPTSN